VKIKYVKYLLFTTALTLAVVSLNREWSKSIHDSIFDTKRTLLSTAVGDVLGDGTPIQVIKVKTGDQLSIEVYAPGIRGSRILVDRIPLEQEQDGYFTFNGELVGIAVDDIEGDKKAEILAPAFDQQLTAHLNVFKYDTTSKSFQRVSGI
jgi:hypothetical protein